MTGEFPCFHVTTEDRLPDILEHGLRPNSKPNRSARGAPYIMLSLYPLWGLYRNYKKNKTPILIEIRDPAITREMFEGDPEGLAWGHTINPEHFKAVVKFEIIKC